MVIDVSWFFWQYSETINIYQKINTIQASNKLTSAAVDGNNTTYKRLIPVHHVTKPNEKSA
jgi:hypothetical protein